jgi:hypothetical protein
LETEQGNIEKVGEQGIIYNKIYKPFFYRNPNGIENKRHKSAGNTKIINNKNNLENSNNNLKYFDDNKLVYGNKISFDPNTAMADYDINNQAIQNFPTIKFEINNSLYNPEPNYNMNLPIENAIKIRKNNNENNKNKLQLEVPEAKNYIMTSTDLVNYGTKTNQSKPINDLKNIFNDNNLNLNTIRKSVDKNDPNNLNTIESITRKFMFSCENNFQEFKPQTVFNSIDYKPEESHNFEKKISKQNLDESKFYFFYQLTNNKYFLL